MHRKTCASNGFSVTTSACVQMCPFCCTPYLWRASYTLLSIDSLIQGLNWAEFCGYIWSGSIRSHLDYKLCMHILLRLCMYIIIYNVCLHVHMYVQYVHTYVDTYLLLFFVASNNHLCIN